MHRVGEQFRDENQVEAVHAAREQLASIPEVMYQEVDIDRRKLRLWVDPATDHDRWMQILDITDDARVQHETAISTYDYELVQFGFEL